MNLAAKLGHWGFDLPRLHFGLRTALASCLALAVAWALGLEHPQWSAMTVWAASQPVRGMLIEKSFFRAAGTLVGTAFGVALVQLTGGNTVALVIGLTLWVTLCAGAGNVLSGLLAYATVLSGYSASMVALLDTADPSIGILSLGADRLLTVMIGIVMALAVGLLFTRRQDEDQLSTRVRQACAETLWLLAARLGARREGSGFNAEQLLSEFAAIEQALEVHGAGSRRAYHSARSIHLVLSALVAGILWSKQAHSSETEDRAAIAELLSKAAQALNQGSRLQPALAALRQARQLTATGSELADLLSQLQEGLEARLHYMAGGSLTDTPVKRRAILHRDWVNARHTMLRTFVILSLIGLLWITTGWEQSAYVMLGTSVMVTLFSTFENPAYIMSHVLMWQIVGACAALLCRWVVWPLAGAEWQLVIMMMPFILVGVIPFSHRRTMPGSMDYNMILLLLSQPAFPLAGSFPSSLAIALAVVVSPLIAYLAFRLIFPTNAVRRQQALKTMMIRELESLAMDPAAPRRQLTWRMRLYHRLMKLVHWSNKISAPLQASVEDGLTVLALGQSILELQRLSQNPELSPYQRKAVQATLRRLSWLSKDPFMAARTLERLANKLSCQGQTVPSLHQGANSLRANLALFELSESHRD